MLKATEIGTTLSDGGQNQVRVFENARFGQIRTAQGASGEPLFCLADVCKALEFNGGARNVKSRLKARGVVSINTPTYNQHGAVVMQEMNFINEANLYRCIFQSRKEEAEQFQDWVCEEVLPAIRQSGGYVATQADDTPELIMARALQKFSPKIWWFEINFISLRRSKMVVIYFAGQAVKLLTSKVGFFVAQLEDIGGCLLRKIIKALGVETILEQRKMAAAFSYAYNHQ